MKFKLMQIAILALLDIVLAVAGLGFFAPALISMKDTLAVLAGFIVLVAVATAIISITLKIASILKSMEQKNA